MKQHTARQRGFEGEEMASTYLQNNGHTILEKNFQCKGGEIDIIASTPTCAFIFVEVKHYLENNWVHPLEAITKQKQKHLIHAAKYYLLKQKAQSKQCRFDAIIITEKNTVEHYQNIFTVPQSYR